MSPQELRVGPCRPKELPALRALLNDVFMAERERRGDVFARAPLLYAESNLANLLVVRRGREIVGHAGVLERPVRWRGQVLRAGLVSGVCVRQGERGEGIGTLVMESAAARMAALDLDFGVLWAGRVSFPERLGWRYAGGITAMRISEAGEAGETRHEIVTIAESGYEPADCHRLHEGAARNEVIRTVEETRTLMTGGGREVLLALRCGRLVGYAAHDGRHIVEIEGDAEACVSLITSAATSGCHLCIFPLNDPRIPEVAEALPVEVQRRPLAMILPVARESLVAKIEAETGETAAALGIGADLDDDALLARVFGDPDRQPTEEPLPLDIHISHLDRV